MTAAGRELTGLTLPCRFQHSLDDMLALLAACLEDRVDRDGLTQIAGLEALVAHAREELDEAAGHAGHAGVAATAAGGAFAAGGLQLPPADDGFEDELPGTHRQWR